MTATRTWLTFLVLACSSQCWGQPPPAERIAAKVNGESITAAEAEREFRLAYGERKMTDAERAALRTAALEQVIDRRLVLAYLAKNNQAATSQDVDHSVALFEKDLKSQNLTLETHLKQVGLSRTEFRAGIAWKLSWQQYVEKQLIDENLQKYFERYRREYDGSELRVAQILFKLPADADDKSIAAAKEKAAKLKAEIAAGKQSFAEAARQHSQAPSNTAGGDIGWIERRRPMPEDFSKTAFALKPGEISEPLVSSFGVHLVTVLEVKPGKKTWQDAATDLRPAVTRYLFRWIADQERPKAKIEYP